MTTQSLPVTYEPPGMIWPKSVTLTIPLAHPLAESMSDELGTVTATVVLAAVELAEEMAVMAASIASAHMHTAVAILPTNHVPAPCQRCISMRESIFSQRVDEALARSKLTENHMALSRCGC